MTVRERMAAAPNWVKSISVVLPVMTFVIGLAANWVTDRVQHSNELLKKDIQTASDTTKAELSRQMWTSMASKGTIETLQRAEATGKQERAELEAKWLRDHDALIELRAIVSERTARK